MIQRCLAIALAGLLAGLPAAAPADAARRGRPATTTVIDKVNYTRGRYLAYAGPWSLSRSQQSAWKRGIEYENSLEVNPDDFRTRGAILINYRWPAKGCSTGVCGYMMASVGNYDGGKPEIPTPPRQISAIKTFSETFDLRYVSGSPEHGGWLNEFFITSAPGNARAKTAEVGFMPHATRAGRAYARSHTYLGDWTDRSTGRKWKVYQHLGGGVAKNYFMFLTERGDYLKGSIDLKAALAYLADLGKIDTNHWVNGVAMGIEPTRNAGSARIDSWTVKLD